MDTVSSPVNPLVKYQETNILYANTASFGMQTGDKSLVSMHEVRATGQVQVKLNLRRKEIEIQLPLTIDHENDMFSFRLPISQLSSIHKTEDGRISSSLIIPFNRPPQFFKHKKLSKEHDGLFSTKDRTWSLWNMMFRETDVVDGRTRTDMLTLPLSDGRGSAVIDIGKIAAIPGEISLTKHQAAGIRTGYLSIQTL